MEIGNDFLQAAIEHSGKPLRTGGNTFYMRDGKLCIQASRRPASSGKNWVQTPARERCNRHFAAMRAVATYLKGVYEGLPVWQLAKKRQGWRMTVENFLMTHLHGRAGCSYMYPAGSGDIAAAIRALEADAAERGEPLRLVCLTPPQMAELEEFFPGRFTCTADRDGYDYLYDIDRLADLGGKKLHAKRNHIHRFEENNPTWAYEEITPASLPECLEMDQEWYRRSLQREGEVEERDLGDEGIALRSAMEHYEALGLEGGLIRVYGEVVAFTIGDRLSADTYDVHFEKAYGELQGAYAMINREFARWVREHHPEVKYLNREDDMGVPGLRKAKESYYPDLLVEKHTAILQKA